jgi:hypothetical protein
MERLRLESPIDFDNLSRKLEEFRGNIRRAYQARDSSFFLRNNDFAGVTLTDQVGASVVSARMRNWTAGAAIAGSLILFGIVTQDIWEHKAGRLSKERDQADLPKTSKSWLKDLPGLDQTVAARPIRPPVSRTNSELALGNDETHPYPEAPLPQNGDYTVWAYTLERIAPLKIQASFGSNHWVKLVDKKSDDDILAVFVRSGATVEINVPLGEFEIRYASGDRWYGPLYHFGPQTSYTKADESFRFTQAGEEVNGFSITLYPVINEALIPKQLTAQSSKQAL